MISINIKGYQIHAVCFAAECRNVSMMIVKMDSGVATDNPEDGHDWVFYCKEHGEAASKHNVISLIRDKDSR